jgi:HEAT repeat protein/transcriptional regulator with XRE-family HTH domain
MGESRKRNSVKLSEAGKQRFIEAKAAKRNYEGNLATDLEIATEAGVSEKTVERFFSGKPVDKKTAIAIATALEVNDLEKWLEPKESNSQDNTPETPIDWHHVCHEMLKTQQEKQKFRQQITGRGLGHEVNVYVPLGLVKPKEQPRRGEDFQPSADRGMLQYQLTEKEIEQEYKHDEFLREVIKEKEKNLAIVGEPGAGKSTWLEEIALYVDNPEKGFPICIPLASLGGKTLEDYLVQIWLKDALPFISPDAVEVTPPLEKKLRKLFHSGKVWLLLDGVDEMRSGTYESPLQTIANNLRGWVDQARVVLTCRFNVWEANPNALPNFETYRTLHFDDQQVSDFIQQWFTREGKPKLGEQLEAKLSESGRERIRDLIKNPLRLAMLCGIWYFNRGDLPKSKATLYNRFLEYFYQWKPHPLLTDDLDKQEELHTALSKLALEAIDKNLSLREKFVHKAMGKSLSKLAREVGWLNWVYKDAETDEDVYAFFHLTFQENFAACAINDWHFFLNHDNENPNPLINPNPSLEYDGGKPAYRIFEPQWKEVILLWLGRMDVEKEQKEEFIRALVEFLDGIGQEFYNYRAYFLAAAGIAEFEDCSWADEIVIQIVRWSIGYFNTKNQRFVTFINVIEEGARAALLLTARTQAVATLAKLIQNSQELFSCWQASERLGEIDQGNPIAVDALVKLSQKFQDKDIQKIFVGSLGKIGKGNSRAIDFLVELSQKSQDESIRREAIDSLGEIGKANSKVGYALTELIRKSENESIRLKAAKSLGRIDKSNFIAIDTLVELICNSQDRSTRSQAALSLGQIGISNPIAVDALVELIRKSQNESTRSQAAWGLEQIGKSRPIAVDALIELLQKSKNESTRLQAARSLVQIDASNPIAIDALVELIHNSQNHSNRWQAVSSLVQIDASNPIAIDALVELIHNSKEESFRWLTVMSLGKIGISTPIATDTLEELIWKSENEFTSLLAAISLLQIDKTNPIATEILVELMRKSGNESTSLRAAMSLGQIDKFNLIAVYALVKLIRSSQNEDICRRTADSLKTILGVPQMAEVVTGLRDYLSDQTYKNDFWRFYACYKLIWHCAQNMPYPEFYRAWHHQPFTPHPEVAETTGVGLTPDSQRLNLAEFPSLLHATINSSSDLSDKVQLICIDGSKFIDLDNPATKIYNKMRRQGCPKSEDSKPKTMAQLQDYWDELNLESDKHLVLVFYQSTPLVREGTAKKVGFSKSFFNDLSKFDGNIGVVTEQPDIPLKSFSPSQSNLAEDIVAWIRRVVLES